MRYFSYSVYGNPEEMMEYAQNNPLWVRGYGKSLDGVNEYLYKTLQSEVNSFFYRHEKNVCYGVFSFDTRAMYFENAFDTILDVLKQVFDVKKVKDDAQEITMCMFIDCYEECKRREYGLSIISGKFLNQNKVWLYNYRTSPSDTPIGFEFKETIASEASSLKNKIYDQGFIKELFNIGAHSNETGRMTNSVHYVIASRGPEAASDMVETLAGELIRSKRILSRRIEYVSEIRPGFYRRANPLEDMIENNPGGLIVFDLSVSFGYEATQYVEICKCLEKLIKKYRNQCVFVFTYNMDDPGFSYYLLPNLGKYLMSVSLREGSSDRKAAIRYMKELIKGSDYAEYSNQAGKYMKRFPGDKFTQTDVLAAFEQFEPWCINRNILHTYDYDNSDDFMLDRDENVLSASERLNQLIGLDGVKRQIESVIASDMVEKERKHRLGSKYQSGTRHMIFAGNPGTAKTTVAKLFAGVAKEKGILKSGVFVERGGMDLDGFGCVYKIREAFAAAKGGVLFIDEAYSIKSDTAATALIQEMENQREEVIVVLAGYNERMKNFLNLNEGLKSRIPYWIDFPDYSTEELTEIFKMMINEKRFKVTDDALKEAGYIFEKIRNTDNFGNGRYVRNLIDNAAKNQAVRLMASGKETADMSQKELFLIKKEDIATLDTGLKKERKPGTAQKEFQEMVGLSSVKEVIRKAMASFKLRKYCIENGISREKSSLHMVFTGNPGTAKTTVARLVAEILKDEKVLSTGNFIEVGRGDIVGEVVGETAKLVKKKFKEAQGGVLFIDEAYSLCDGYENGYGDEAINTIVQEMENHRDNVIVIFAGYPEPMKHFLERNPGMLSRIAFQIEFEDYSTEELCEITKLMLSKKQMKISDAAMSKLRDIYKTAAEREDFGNGRFVRKTLEEAEMNLAERVLQYKESEITTELISTIEECDIPNVSFEKKTVRRMGFAC